ncbi:MAG: prephenate dehydratase [Chloroflexi bacterium]|nr:prephenate dehydratase [Chloroflexota bacterium]
MDLESCRRQIDEIDEKVVALLNARAEVALQIKEIKAGSGKAVYDPQREKAVYGRLLAISSGPLPPASLKAVYREIISACRALQNPLKVAYFGPMGSFTHEAAMLRFGSTTELVAAPNIGEVFSLVARGEADFGVVPVENSTEGFVGHTLDMLAESELRICAEIALPISQCLLSRGSRDDIRVVYSHPQSLAQTRRWLQQHLPDVEQMAASSNSRAAQMAADDPSAAAIGPELAGEIYGLQVIERGIQDNPDNVTRFLVIGGEMGKPTGNDKSSVMFTVKHRVGSLHAALGVLQRHGINLTRIDSRPSRLRTWEYVFFIDMVGHPEDANVAEALAELAEECVLVKVLGAWAVE